MLLTRQHMSDVCLRQGFVQFDVGEEEESGQMGSVARREKQQKEREKRQLSGHEGKALYLEALQLLLRRQTMFLVREKGYQNEVEIVVRDLWDLRLRGYTPLTTESAATDIPLELFSSQPNTSEDEEETPHKPWSRARYWNSQTGTSWPLPKAPETLALCYLGCLLLQIPTRLRDLQMWALNGGLPYLKAVSFSSSSITSFIGLTPGLAINKII